MAHLCKYSGSPLIVALYAKTGAAQPFLRRLITRMIGLVPSMVVAIAVGRPGINTLLVASQVALSVVLPFVAFPLIWLTSSKSIMSVKVPRKSDTFGDTTQGYATATLDAPPSILVAQDESPVTPESVRNIVRISGFIMPCTEQIDLIDTESGKAAIAGERRGGSCRECRCFTR